jgi:hypothetical protein
MTSPNAYKRWFQVILPLVFYIPQSKQDIMSNELHKEMTNFGKKRYMRLPVEEKSTEMKKKNVSDSTRLSKLEPDIYRYKHERQNTIRMSSVMTEDTSNKLANGFDDKLKIEIPTDWEVTSSHPVPIQSLELESKVIEESPVRKAQSTSLSNLKGRRRFIKQSRFQYFPLSCRRKLDFYSINRDGRDG